MNIALIGPMYAGKTTISKLLAKSLDKKLISTDEEIVKKTKMNIQKFIKKYGLEKFREIESEVVENISNFDDCIFDTGTNIVLRNENIINLKKNALIVLLMTDIKTITNRLKKGNRQSSAKSNQIVRLKLSLEEHEQRFKKAADYTIDTSRLSSEEVCNLIKHYIQMEIQ